MSWKSRRPSTTLPKEEISQWIANSFIMPIVERVLIFAGLWPDNLEIEVQWKVKDALTAQTLKDVAQAAAVLDASSLVSPETTLRLLARFIPDFNLEAELEAAEEREAQEERMMARLAMNGDSNGQEPGQAE